MKFNFKKKVLSSILAVCMLFSQGMIPVFAYEGNATEVKPVESGVVAATIVTGFAALNESVHNQAVPVDTTLAELTLPGTLTATGTTTGSGAAVELTIEGVTWALDPANAVNAGNDTYDPAGGSYAFTPVLPAGYTVAEGASLPEICVMVGGVAQPMVFDKIVNGGVTAEINGYSQEIFANGNPITIAASGEGSNDSIVYYTDDSAKTPIVLDALSSLHKGNGVYDLFGCHVYGGGTGGLSGNTSVTMSGGIVSIVYGGGRGGPVDGNTSVIITGGTVDGNVLGGGNNATVTGNTSVTMSGGKVNSGVFGGGNNGFVNGNTSVTVTGGTVNGSVRGGGNFNATVGGTKNGFVTLKDKALANTFDNLIYVDKWAASTLLVQGSYTLTESFTIPAGTTLQIPAGTTLTIPADATLTVSDGATLTVSDGATLTNNGTIDVYGTLAGTAPAGTGKVRRFEDSAGAIAFTYADGKAIGASGAVPGMSIKIKLQIAPVTKQARSTIAEQQAQFYLDSGATNPIGDPVTVSPTGIAEVTYRIPENKDSNDLAIYAEYGQATVDGKFLKAGDVTGVQKIFRTVNGGVTAKDWGSYQEIFANGNPITIAASGNDSIVYYTDDSAKTPIVLDALNAIHKGDGVYDLTSCDIYGGGTVGSSISFNTNVTMTGGNVAAVYGGGRVSGTVGGNTIVTVTGGTVGAVYGGGNGGGTVTGNTTVTVTGGTVGDVYGGGNGGGTVSGTKTGLVTLLGKAQADSFDNLLYADTASTMTINGNNSLYTLGQSLTIPAGTTLTIPERYILGIKSGATLTISEGATVIIPAGTTLDNGSGGTIINNGTIDMIGMLNGNNPTGSGKINYYKDATDRGITVLDAEGNPLTDVVAGETVTLKLTAKKPSGRSVSPNKAQFYLGTGNTGTAIGGEVAFTANSDNTVTATVECQIPGDAALGQFNFFAEYGVSTATGGIGLKAGTATGSVTIAPMASDGTNNYANIQAAITAANASGGTIKLLRDSTYGERPSQITGTFTLDLNGKTLTMTHQFGQLKLAGTNPHLTITDSAGGGKVTGTHNQYTAVEMSSGTLTVKGGTLEGLYAIKTYGGTVEISGGILKGKYISLFMADGNAKLTGGTFHKCTDDSIYAPSGKTVADLLAPGYLYYAGTDTTGAVVKGNVTNLGQTVTVGECVHSWSAWTESGGKLTRTCQNGCKADDGNVTTEIAAAKVGDTYYTDIQAAFDAAGDGATVTLAGNSSYEKQKYVDITKKVTLDLNGKTLTMETIYGIKISNSGAHLTITDSKTGGKLFTAGDGCTLVYVEAGTLTVNSGSIETKVGISSEDVTVDTNGTAIINGGSFRGGLRTLKVYSGGKATLKGGTFYMGRDASITTNDSDDNTTDAKLDTLLAPGYVYYANGTVVSGDVTAFTETVTVQLAPVKITTQPANVSANYGYTTAPPLEVKATAVGGNATTNPITYQWYTAVDDGEITGATGASYTVPAGKAVGDYGYYCKLSRDGYTVQTNTATLTVNKAPVTTTNTNYAISYTYTGSAIATPTAANFTTNGGTMSFAWKQGETPSSIPTNAGTYTLTVTTTATANVAAGSADFTVTVNPATPTMTFGTTTQTSTYSGSPVTVTAEPKVTLVNGEAYTGDFSYAYKKVDTFLYGLFEGYTDGMPTDVGKYKIRAHIAAGGNYKAADSDNDLALTIEKVTTTLTITHAGASYTGKPVVAPTPASNITNPTVTYAYYKDNGGSKGDALSGAPTDAGTYWVEGTIAETPNTTAVTSTAITFTIAKIAPTITVTTSKSSELGNKDIKVTVTITNPAGATTGFPAAGEIDIDPDNATIKGSITQTGTTGVYTATYTLGDYVAGKKASFKATVPTATTNYNADATGTTSSDVEILDKYVPTITLAASKTAPTYGESVTLTATVGKSGNTSDLAGTVQFKLGGNNLGTAGGINASGVATLTVTKEDLTAGAKSFTAEFTPTAISDYKGVASTATTVTVAQKGLTITGVTAETRAYDTTDSATLTGGTLVGVLSGDTVSFTLPTTGNTFVDANVGANKKVTIGTITLTGADKDNYTLTQPDVKGTITAKNITPTITAIAPATYDGTAQKPALTVMDESTPLTAGTDYTAAYSDNVNAGVDTGKVVVTLKGNYSGSANATFTIGKATATGVDQTYVVAKAKAQSYSFDLRKLLPSIKGLTGVTYVPAVTTNTDSVLDTITYTTGDTLTLPVKAVDANKTATVTVTITSDNYADFTAKITVNSINKTPVSITATMASGVYNGSTHGYSNAVIKKNADNSVVTGITLEALYESTSGAAYSSATAPTKAGKYKLTLSVLADATYQGSEVFAFEIAKKEVTVQADNKQMVKGEPLPAFTVSYTGFVGTENDGDAALSIPATAACTADGNTVGSFDITIATPAALDATAGANYTIIAQNNGKLTVSEKTFTVTVTDGTGGGTYAVGATVTITASGKANHSFTSWTATGATLANASSATTTFTMPGNNVSITANYSYNGGGNSGGGGNDNDNDDDNSSGGGDYIPPSNDNSYVPPTTPAPAPTQPTTPTEGEKTISAKPDANGNATITLGDKDIANIIKQAQNEAKKNGATANGISVVINVKTTGKNPLNSLSVSLPKSVQDQLIAAGVESFRFKSESVGISFDQKALAQLKTTVNADVSIKATKADASKLSQQAKQAIGNRPVFMLTATTAGGKAITSFGDGYVSVTQPYVLGINENPGNLCGVYVDGNGKPQWLTNSSYDSNTETFGFITNHFSIYGVGYKTTATAFSDSATHWAKNSIDFVVSRGLFDGTSKTAFSPNSGMTRGAFVTALGRLAGINSTQYKNTRFTDVSATAYYAPYVAWAADYGITSGTSSTTFSPDKVITRQELAVFMQNYANVNGYVLPKTRAAVTFADAGSIGAFAKDAVVAVQMAGVMNGKNGSKIDPTGTATRAEVAATLHRYVELAIDIGTAQGLDVNDSGSAIMYENGKMVKSAKRTVGGNAYSFNANGEAALLPQDKRYLTHTVEKGDNFWAISRKYKVSMFELAKVNGKTIFSMIRPGDVLKLPQ